MNPKNLLKCMYLFVILALLVACSCNPLKPPQKESNSTIQSTPSQALQLASENFLKIKFQFSEKVCTDKGRCDEVIYFYSGSAFALRMKGRVLVVTAEHICRPFIDQQDSKNKLWMLSPNYSYEVKYSFVDKRGTEYTKATILETNKTYDICTLEVEGLKLKGLKVSDKSPIYGETFYNIAAPGGVTANNVPLIFSGQYVGIDEIEMGELKKRAALYTFPVWEGSSGSMVVNEKGEVVGVVHTKNTEMEHLGFATPWSSLRLFLVLHYGL